MPGYMPQFSVAFIDDQGFRQILANEDINVLNVTTSTPDSDLTTNDEGILVEGTLAGSAGDVIELSHDTYPLTMRFVLQASQLEAYTAVENDITTFIVENLFTDTEDATSAEIYLVDPDEPDTRQLLGSAKVGTTTLFPYQPVISKTMRVFSVAKGEDFLRTENAFKDDHGVDVYIPAPRQTFSALFDQYVDATTTGTSRETLYTNNIPGNTLFQDGDKIMFRYSGNYAVGINTSSLFVHAFGTDIADSQAQAGNGEMWTIEGWIIRVSDSTARYASIFNASTIGAVTQSGEITSLDLTNTAYDFELDAETAASAGDVTATIGTAWFVPAAPTVSIDGLLFGGDTLIFDGDGLLFNP